MPTISFILVNFHSSHLLPHWFASLNNTRLSPSDFEVIVVNNDASEVEALQNLSQQYSFFLLQSPGNIGFGAANNRAAQKAKGRILAFINPDTRFLPGNFEELIDLFQRMPKLGAVGLKLVTKEDTIQEWSAGSKVTLWDIIRNNLFIPKSRHAWESQKPISVDWVSGAALFIPKDVFGALGGFDETFFLYFEDIDLCDRIKDAGKEIYYFPPLSVRHIGGQSSSSTTEQKQHYYHSQDLYFKKHRPKWEELAIQILRRLICLKL